jgi:hypothetical protein
MNMLVTTIEKPFLDALERLIFKSSSYLFYKYKLWGYEIFDNSEKQDKLLDLESDAKHSYDAFEKYEDYLDIYSNLLCDEIEHNIRSCATEFDVNSYIFSVMTRFAWYSEVMFPLLSKKNDDDKQIENIKYRSDKLNSICKNPADEVERIFSRTVSDIDIFGYRFDVLLLKQGYDLMYLQKLCGIAIYSVDRNIEERSIDRVVLSSFLGSEKLLDYYLKNANKGKITPSEQLSASEGTVEGKKENEQLQGLLSSDEAKAILWKARQEGFLDANNMPLNLSSYGKALFCRKCSWILNWGSKIGSPIYAPFNKLWGDNNLATYNYHATEKAKEEAKYVNDFFDELPDIDVLVAEHKKATTNSD